MTAVPAANIEPCAVGMNLINMREAMEEQLGKEMVARAIVGLPDDTRHAYDRILPTSWVPFAISWAVVDAVADAAGKEREQFYVDVCKAGMRRAMKTVWRVFLHFTSDEALVKRTAIIFAKSRNVGAMSARHLAPGQSEVVVTSWPNMLPRHKSALAAAMEEVLSLAGRKNVSVTSKSTPDGAQFAITFQP